METAEITTVTTTNDYEEFRKRVLKANVKKHKFRINNSYGTKDIYRWVKKNKLFKEYVPTESEFRVIVNALNMKMQENLLDGKDIIFPYNLGILELRKIDSKILYKEGKLVTNMPVDWKRTLQYWFEDKDAEKNKKLLRTEVKEKFKIHYRKSIAKYNNKIFIGFSPTRSLKIKLKDRINSGSIDALLKGKKYEFYRY